MYQEILVVIIGVLVAAQVLYKLYTFFFVKNKQKGSCGCSNCGCNLAKKEKNI